MYPSPTPGVFRIKPRRVSAAAINSKPVKTFEFVVYGQSFVSVKLELERMPPKAVAKATLSPPDLFGTFRGSILRTLVSPPAGELQFTAGDKFKVIVKNNPGTALETDVGPGNALPLEITP